MDVFVFKCRTWDNFIDEKAHKQELIKKIEESFKQNPYSINGTYPEYDFDQNAEFNKHKVIQNKIPSRFMSLKEWPKKTRIKCWICKSSFDTIPKFDPDFSKIDYVGVTGSFCTFVCLSTYIRNKYGVFEDMYANKRSDIIRLYRLFNNSSVLQIPEANPPYTRTKEYGGDLTTKEYKALIEIQENEIELNHTVTID